MTRILFYILAVALIMAGSAAELCAQPDSDPALRDHVYLVVLEPGPAWVEGKPVGEQGLREHGRYLMARYAEGKMIQAGPFTDDSGGAILYRAESMAEAEALVAADPAVLSGILAPTVFPWRRVEWDYHLDKATLGVLNDRFVETFISGDAEAREKMIHPDFIRINGDGTITSREAYLAGWVSAYRHRGYTSFSISEEDIRVFGNTALVRSKVIYTREVNGETIRGNSLYTDTYIRENGRWMCVQVHAGPTSAE